MIRSTLAACIVMIACVSRDDLGTAVGTKDSGLALDSLRCVQIERAKPCPLFEVSMYELIAQPREWHGKRVRVIGFSHFHDEENLLFASKEDWRRNISANAVGLSSPTVGRDSLNHRDVLVEATFDAHSGASLQQVTRFESWESMARPQPADVPEIHLKKPLR